MATAAPLPPARPASDLRREDFAQTLNISVIRVEGKHCTTVMNLLKPLGLLLRRRNIKSIINDPANPSWRRICLDPAADLAAHPAILERVAAMGGEVVPGTVSLTYDNVPVDVVLRALLPEGVEAPSGFEPVGHLAHVNLRDEQLPYRYLIGQVLLDKNPSLKTIVNKVGVIETEFRTFPMEVIAGEDNTVVEVVESGCTFRFNFSEVYWNSKLQTEHSRMAQKFPVTDIICDMFCGIGPFAIPLAMRGCTVYANDLNPLSYKYLVQNAALNKVSDRVHGYNLDGRVFVRQLVSAGVPFKHVLMNLPAIAIEFLDVFVGLFPESWAHPLPTVHCYCFSAKEASECVKDVEDRVAAVLGLSAPPAGIEVRAVRDVAPKKMMFCVSFPIPEEVGRASPAAPAPDATPSPTEGDGCEPVPPPGKKVKTVEE